MAKIIKNFKKKEILMEIDCLGTGSTGNCYIIKDINGRAIILDCGIKFQDITHHETFPKFINIDFVFVSHSHSDHNRSINEFKKTGCEIISYETLQPKVQTWKLGNWECITFPLPHNVPNWGIVIASEVTHEKLCYMTDFTSAPKVEGVDYWLYEVNYIERLIDQMIDEDKDLKHLGFNNHNSLENAKSYFSSLKTRQKVIMCCHSSGNHAIKQVIKEELEPFADEVTVL